jgi:hypothetical protein
VDYDPGRGGWGHEKQVELEELERKRHRTHDETYESVGHVPSGAYYY